MKYQHILNGKVLFETNDVSEYFKYLITSPEANQAKHSVLYNLLDKSNGYICNMASVVK